MSLSLRKVSENPWDVFAREHQSGQTIHGRVTRVADFGIFVEISEGIEGLVHISEISNAPNKHLLSNYQAGQEIFVKLLSIDLSGRKVSLSIKAVADEEAQGAVREYLEATVNSGGHNMGENFPQELRQKSHTAD
jgi:small subunit ribosomal protein S1